jgi:hypothetical protein
MSPGTSKIIKKSQLDKDTAKVLLSAKYFESKPVFTSLSVFSNFFKWDNPTTEIERSIVSLLDKEEISYNNMTIEYWFQHQKQGQQLKPHCDYNHIVRAGSAINFDVPEKVMSPITIGCYLQVEDMTGGELCISDHTWFNEPNPLSINSSDIKKYPYETYVPQLYDIIYFEGSKYFHWINPVIKGERKSMMINFWPLDLGILEE